jgi:hypothetical protein
VRRGASDLLAALAAGGVAAVAARAAYTALRRRPPAGQQTWTRVNHRGDELTLLEGPALAVAAIATELAAAAISQRNASQKDASRAVIGQVRGFAVHPARQHLAAALAGTGAVGFGVLDDLAGSAKRKGLRGHLGALAHGEVTTGAVKLAGIGVTGLASGVTLGGGPADVVINAGLIAGSANLLNLFDLRPGRAIKVATLSAALIGASDGCGNEPAIAGSLPHPSSFGRVSGAVSVAAPLGAALALLGEDLGERAMLGDAGANALGAMLGAAAAAALPRRARIAALGMVIALTVASEKISFTKVIASTPPLHWLDMLGRRPAAPSVTGASTSGLPPVNSAADGTAAGAAGPDRAAQDLSVAAPTANPAAEPAADAPTADSAPPVAGSDTAARQAGSRSRTSLSKVPLPRVPISRIPRPRLPVPKFTIPSVSLRRTEAANGAGAHAAAPGTVQAPADRGRGPRRRPGRHRRTPTATESRDAAGALRDAQARSFGSARTWTAAQGWRRAGGTGGGRARSGETVLKHFSRLTPRQGP